MPQQKISISEFASRIKAQYPEYAELPNLDLTRAVLRKYPDYQNVLDVHVPLETPETATPPSTAGTRAAEIALGAAESLGIDPGRPVVGTAKNLASGVGVLLRAGVESVERGGLGGLAGLGLDIGLAGLGLDIATKAVPAVASSLIEGPREALTGYAEDDPNRMARGVGMTLGVAGSMLMPVKGYLARVPVKPAAIARAAVEAPKQLSGAAVELMTKRRNPNKAMVVALKPKSTNVYFTKDLDLALPEVKVAESQLGRPIAGLQDLTEAIPIAKRNVRAQYDAIGDPQRLRQIDGSPIADAINNSVAPKIRLQDPRKAAHIADLANTYRRTFTLEELEDFLKTTNAQLESHYQKYPSAQRAQLARDPDIAYREAEARALRDVAYGSFDLPGGGQAPRELQRRYGALMNFEKETRRRFNVAQRQQFDSLTQQLGKVQAAFEIGKAGVELLSMQPFKAAGRLGAAYAGRKAANMIREANSADALIAGVFKYYARTPAPIVKPSPIPVSRQLTRGSLITPLSDTSYVRGAPAQPAQSAMIERLLLPERTAIITPPPPDPSFVRGVPAKPGRRIPLLPERASGPYITPPPRESLLDELRRRAGRGKP